jgi:hypothetical protein
MDPGGRETLPEVSTAKQKENSKTTKKIRVKK